MTPNDAQKIVKRLASAEGYLELGLPQYALADLGQVPDAGPFEAIAQLLKGEALQAEQRLDEAIGALNRAAELFPKPFNQRALLGLSRCYRLRGEEALALQAEAEATPPDLPPGATMQMVVMPIFKVEDKPSPRRPPRKG
jgi:tetratricopeptide (TPR) repeat protein